MTPEEERALKVAALGWQLRAERLEAQVRTLHRRPTWPAFLLATFAAVLFFAIDISLVVTR